MANRLSVKAENIQAMQDLVNSGDLDLLERREVFRVHRGRNTTLSDDQLLIACAATDDDDDALFVQNAGLVEQGEYDIVGSQAA